MLKDYRRKCDLALENAEIQINKMIIFHNPNRAFVPILGTYITMMERIVKGYEEKKALFEKTRASTEEQEVFYKKFYEMIVNIENINFKSNLLTKSKDYELIYN